MTEEETRARMNALADDIDNGALGEALGRAAMNANALINDRIVKTGKNAEGSLYPPYSTNPMYVWCPEDKKRDKYGRMTDKACAKAQARYKRKRPKGSTEPLHSFLLVGGYKEYRELHERPTQFVDFLFKGDMWGNITLVTTSDDHKKGKARISAPNPDQYAKLAGNTQRKGQILDLNQEEIKLIAQVIGDELEDLIAKHGLL